MLSLLSLYRRWQARTRKPGLFPRERTEGVLDTSRGSQDDLSYSDLTYDDALLDTQLRLFFYSEFRNADAPEGTLDRVLQTIEQHHAKEARAKATFPSLPSSSLSGATHALQALRGVLTGPTVARIVPGGVALMLVLASLGPNLSQILNGDTGSRYFNSPSSVVSEIETEYDAYSAVSRMAEKKLSERLGERKQPSSPALYDPGYDPPETWAPPEALPLQRFGIKNEPDRGKAGVNGVTGDGEWSGDYEWGEVRLE